MTDDAPQGRSESAPMTERMQALLARAAEEQLSEQRQVSVVLAELRSLVLELGEVVGQRLGAVELRLDELAAQLEATAHRAAPTPPAPSALAPPTAEAVAAALAERLTDRLAPPVVALVQQHVLSAVADSEQRLAAHVDDAVLALAGVLLRRERGVRAEVTGAAEASDGPSGATSQDAATATPHHAGPA